jgi:hypothetical protein
MMLVKQGVKRLIVVIGELPYMLLFLRSTCDGPENFLENCKKMAGTQYTINKSQ